MAAVKPTSMRALYTCLLLLLRLLFLFSIFYPTLQCLKDFGIILRYAYTIVYKKLKKNNGIFLKIFGNCETAK